MFYSWFDFIDHHWNWDHFRVVDKQFPFNCGFMRTNGFGLQNCSFGGIMLFAYKDADGVLVDADRIIGVGCTCSRLSSDLQDWNVVDFVTVRFEGLNWDSLCLKSLNF